MEPGYQVNRVLVADCHIVKGVSEESWGSCVAGKRGLTAVRGFFGGFFGVAGGVSVEKGVWGFKAEVERI